MTTPTNAPPAKNAKQAPPPMGPFRGGTEPTVKATGYSNSTVLTTATQDLPDYEVGPTNILRCIYLEVNAAASGNSATVAFQPDAPLNVFSTVNFQDSGGNAIVGSFDSYTLGMVQKWGGYARNSDPRSSAVYSATTGSGSTGGSFNIVYRIPVEAVSRSGLGSLQNQSTQSPFVLSLTLNSSGSIYSTAPTAEPTVTTKIRLGGYWKGASASYSPTPKAYGTTQYWNRSSIQGLNGASQFQLPNNGLGNPLRTVMFINYATGGARSGADFPDPLQVTFRGNNLVQYSQNLWKDEMSRVYGYNVATLDAANGLDTGVFVLPFNTDFGNGPGDELGLGYLSTNVGDEIQLVGSWAASSTLYEVVNFLSVKGAPNAVQGLT